SFFPERSQWKLTFTWPPLSVWISSPEGPVVIAVCAPCTIAARSFRGGRYFVVFVGTPQNSHLYVDGRVPPAKCRGWLPVIRARITRYFWFSGSYGCPSTEKRSPGSSASEPVSPCTTSRSACAESRRSFAIFLAPSAASVRAGYS